MGKTDGVPISMVDVNSKSGTTRTFMVLFAPSPNSFYRVKEFAHFEKAKARKWCEEYATVPMVYVRLIACEADELRDWVTIARCRAAKCRFMVLWKVMEPCYHSMREFEQFQDAIQYASETRTRLQELQASRRFSHHGLLETLRVFAFTLAGEWNIANKPAE